MWQATSLRIEISFSLPKTASSNVTVIVYCKSSPFLGAFGSRCCLPPPKNELKISSNPPPPNPLKSWPPNPWPPKPPCGPSCPNWS